MNRFFRPFILLLFLLPFHLFAQSTEDQLAGVWLGKIEVGKQTYIRLAFTVKSEGDKWVATMASPDQDLFDLPVSGVTVDGNKVRLEVNKLKGEWNGIYNADADLLEGDWIQAGKNFPCALSRVDSVPRVNRPQTPMKPFPYATEDVVVKCPQGGHTLAGTLSMPTDGQHLTAAILITGSGGQDRDESILGHKPFAVIADYLTQNGIAVLRLDDRGIGKSTGDFFSATSVDFANDISAAVDFLKGRPEIDPTKIGLIGHSEGGVVGPMVAAQRNDVAYVVMLAGLGTTGAQVLIEQGQLISKAEGISDDGLKFYADYQAHIFDLIREEDDVAKLKKKIRKYNEKFLKSCPTEIQEELGLDAEGAERSMKTLITPWFRYFIVLDPASYLPKVKCPVLAVNGDKDLQVPSTSNLPAIERLLKEGGNEDVMIREIPNLNHLFQTTETGAVSEYSVIEETFSPSVLRLMGDWINEKMK